MKTLVKWTISDYHKMIESDILTGRNCELIDGEIIEIAVKLGSDPVWRNSIVEQMSQNHHRLFEDKTCVDGLEAFYKQVVEEKSSSSS